MLSDTALETINAIERDAATRRRIAVFEAYWSAMTPLRKLEPEPTPKATIWQRLVEWWKTDGGARPFLPHPALDDPFPSGDPELSPAMWGDTTQDEIIAILDKRTEK